MTKGVIFATEIPGGIMDDVDDILCNNSILMFYTLNPQGLY